MITLRPYQEAAIDAIMAAIPTDKTILIQAATGAGKTIIFCELIRRLLSEYPYIRIGILAHRRELITQAQDKLLKVWPSAPIGIACASVSGEIDTEQPVVIGSVQTLSRRTKTTTPFDLVIIDEAHRVPPANEKSQYGEWIDTMTQYNSNIRILGVTATPFRLGHGYIYGNACKSGNKNLFEDLHYRISISDLQNQGYLCGYRAKAMADISGDLAGVRKVGDYNIGDLSVVMSKQQHVGSAVAALNEHASDRRHVVVFAVTIAHAEKLREAFGNQATIIHSELKDSDRIQALSDFDAGLCRVIVNVGVLTEGWDSPAIDCIIMCRPTVSPGLFVQMTGRGLRPHPDKEDVLILDLANNCKTHGDPDQPQVVIPNKTKKTGNLVLESRGKVCPSCQEVVELRTTVCPECGFKFVEEKNDPVILKEYHFKKQKPESIVVEIGDAYLTTHVSKAGNLMAKLSLACWAPGNSFPYHINHFLQFEPAVHPYARRRSRHDWRRITGGDEPPDCTEEAIERHDRFLGCLGSEPWIEIEQDGKFWKILDWKAKAPEAEPAPIFGQYFRDMHEAPAAENDELPF